MARILSIYPNCSTGGMLTVYKNRLRTYYADHFDFIFQHDLGGRHDLEQYPNASIFIANDTDFTKLVHYATNNIAYDIICITSLYDLTYNININHKTKSVYEIHTSILERLKKEILALPLNLIDEIWTPSTYLSDCTRVFLPIEHHDKLQTVPNIADWEMFNPDGFNFELDLPEDTTPVLWVGRLNAPKNLKGFFRVLAILNKKFHGIILVNCVVEEISEALYEVELLKIHDRVHFLQDLSQAKLAGLYRFAASRRGWFCSTSLSESFGYSVLEAALVGLPVLTYDYASLAEFWHWDFGIEAADPGDAFALAKLFETSDWETLKEKSLSARERYKQGTFDRPNSLLAKSSLRPLFSTGQPTSVDSDVSKACTGGQSRASEHDRAVEERIEALLQQAEKRQPKQFESISDRAAYILHHSLPYSNSGYSIRSQGFIKGLQAAGMDIQVVTAPGFPLDDFPNIEDAEAENNHEIDGVIYHRIHTPCRKGLVHWDYLYLAAGAIETWLSERRPQFVMAASNYSVALPAIVAARRLGLPFIYEVRGFWEITASSLNKQMSARWLSQNIRLESQTAAASDMVLTLNGAMAKELIRRGVNEQRIFLVPNSCDPNNFSPLPKDSDIAGHYELPEDVPVIGYIGSFVNYEGLDDLVQACCQLRNQGLEFRLLLVGSEAPGNKTISPRLIELAQQGGLGNWLILAGRIPHDTVKRYYSLLDVVVMPRKGVLVCELVSPLKPLEAMAMGKALLVSTVHPLEEMIENRRTGLLFEKDNIESLVHSLSILLSEPGLRVSLGRAARKWVETQRTWRVTAKNIAAAIRGLN